MKAFGLVLISSIFMLTACDLSFNKSNRQTASLGQSDDSKPLSNLKKLQRSLSETASLRLVGSNAKVALFFLDESNPKLLNILICKPISIVKDGKTCTPAKGTEKVKIPVDVFLAHIGLLVRGSYERLLEFNRADKKEVVKVAFSEQDQARLDLLKKFTIDFNQDSLGEKFTKELERLESRLETKVAQEKVFEETKSERYDEENLDAIIRNSLDEISSRLSSLKIDDVLYEKETDGSLVHQVLDFFVYNTDLSRESLAVDFRANKNKFLKKTKVGNVEIEYVEIDKAFKKIIDKFFDERISLIENLRLSLGQKYLDIGDRLSVEFHIKMNKSDGALFKDKNSCIEKSLQVAKLSSLAKKLNEFVCLRRPSYCQNKLRNEVLRSIFSSSCIKKSYVHKADKNNKALRNVYYGSNGPAAGVRTRENIVRSFLSVIYPEHVFTKLKATPAESFAVVANTHKHVTTLTESQRKSINIKLSHFSPVFKGAGVHSSYYRKNSKEGGGYVAVKFKYGDEYRYSLLHVRLLSDRAVLSRAGKRSLIKKSRY